MRSWLLAVLAIALAGCAVHRMYDAGQFRQRELQHRALALGQDGLSAEQIAVISATLPPQTFPVDVAVILLKSGYIDTRLEDMFAYDLIQELKKSEKIDRVILLPAFLIPEQVSFNTIQELGVRSLSEYVLVFHCDASEFFRWTAIAARKYEVNSTISFMVVDSGTAAMLTADRLHSTEQYTDNLFKIGEQERAQREVFSEQARLLGAKLDALFGGR